MIKALTASCLCKGIKFKTKGEHRNVSNCHCIQCRKTHGIFGAYSNVHGRLNMLQKYHVFFYTEYNGSLKRFYAHLLF